MDMNELVNGLLQTMPTFIFGILSYWLKLKLDKMEKQSTERDKFTAAIAYGSLVSLRKQIHDLYLDTVKNGYISPEQYDIVCDMFEAYTQLGGNHGVSKMMDEIKNYPSAPIDID